MLCSATISLHHYRSSPTPHVRLQFPNFPWIIRPSCSQHGFVQRDSCDWNESRCTNRRQLEYAGRAPSECCWEEISRTPEEHHISQQRYSWTQYNQHFELPKGIKRQVCCCSPQFSVVRICLLAYNLDFCYLGEPGKMELSLNIFAQRALHALWYFWNFSVIAASPFQNQFGSFALA